MATPAPVAVVAAPKEVVADPVAAPVAKEPAVVAVAAPKEVVAAPVAAPVAKEPAVVAVAAPAPVAEPTREPVVAVAEPVVAVLPRKDDTSEDSADKNTSGAAVPAAAAASTAAAKVDSSKGKDEAAGSAAAAAPSLKNLAAVSEQLWLAEMNAENERRLVEAPFDSKAWTNAFRQAKRDNDEARVSYLRRVVQLGTNNVLNAKAYDKEGHRVPLGDTVESVKRTTFYDGKVAFGSFNRYHQTTAHFVKADAVDVALFLMDKKNVNPVVLVMADEKRPGGAHAEGTCAQEESIYRRTTLKLNLEDTDGVAKDREWKYEIAPFGGIYAPDVQVFRSSEGRGYEYLPQPKKLAFICASSLASPQLETNKKTQQKMLSDDDAKVTQRKIETILNIGLQNGHDAIVLSAFGCGYNKNPPHHIARLFREVITTQFPACFRHVTFAILDDENTRLEHNPEGNIKPFQDEFLNVSSRVASKKCTLM